MRETQGQTLVNDTLKENTEGVVRRQQRHASTTESIFVCNKIPGYLHQHRHTHINRQTGAHTHKQTHIHMHHIHARDAPVDSPQHRKKRDRERATARGQPVTLRIEQL